MAKIDLYKVSKKNGFTLLADIDPIFLTDKLARNQKVARRNETLDIILNVEKIDEELLEKASASDYLKVVKENGLYKIVKPSLKTNKKLHDAVKNAFLDTLYQNDVMLTENVAYRDLFIHYGRFNYGGFYGIIHKIFPIVFIMHGIAGFQPMVWDMIIGDKYYQEKNKEALGSHYNEIKDGINQAYHNITLTQVENTALEAINGVIKEDKDGEGFNKAAKLCDRLGLGSLKNFLWPATQATEDTEWDIYKRPPIQLIELPEKEKGDKEKSKEEGDKEDKDKEDKENKEDKEK